LRCGCSDKWVTAGTTALRAENNVGAKHLGPRPGIFGADGNRDADLPPTILANPPPPEFYDNKK